jgi:hypothetical protein
MAARAPSEVRRQRQRRLNRGHRDQRPRPTRPEVKPEQDSSEEEQGFLFDPYWDEVFAAYYEPYLRTCCPIR